MRNYFTLAGRDSRDFGIYISGAGTFNAPEKAYQFFEIPGRNGDLIGNDHRLMNVELTYHAFIYTNFRQNVREFRSFLLSLNGYQKLTDSYHPDEYRMACYVGAFEAEPTPMLDAGEFDITFVCKPQRYLFSGEATYRFDQTGQFVGSQILVGQSIQAYVPWLDRSVYTYFRWEAAANNGRPQSSPENVQEIRSLESVRIYENGVTAFFWFFGYTKYTKAVMYPLSGTGSGYAEEKSVPTTGWTLYGTNIFSHAFHGCSAANWCTHYPVYASAADLASVPYGIAIDGELGEETMYIKDSRYTTAEAFMANVPLANIKVDAQLSAPVAWEPTMPYYPYFPTSPGTAEISTDPGALLTMRYDAPPNRLANPTPFDSQPLIRIYGTGSVEINGITITVSSVGTSYTDIDCELMDCYEGSTNRNAYVSFSTYDFPVLVPGVTDVNVIDNTITAVEIKPRWWVV